MFEVKSFVGAPGTSRRRLIVRLFIADDNIPFRTRLASIFADVDGISVVGVAGDVPGAIEEIKRLKPDTIILDIHMPGGNGLDVLQVAKAFSPAPTVIMLTVGPRNEYETASYLIGADYFFEKSSDLKNMARLLKSFARKSLA
jgi:two-component system, NarL family, nitrate/nitrite response regulator NarL